MAYWNSLNVDNYYTQAGSVTPGWTICEDGKFIVSLHHIEPSDPQMVNDLAPESTDALICGYPDTANPNGYKSCY